MMEAEFAQPPAPRLFAAGPTMTKVRSEFGRHQAEADAAGLVLLGLAGDIDVAALARGVEVLARVGVMPLSTPRLLPTSQPSAALQRRGLEALEIGRRARVGGLADARLEAQELVAAAAERRVDVDFGRDVEDVGVRAGARHDDRAREFDPEVARARREARR